VPTLIGLSVVKFALVVMWFMHLKFDSPTYARYFLMGLAGATTLYLVVLISFGVFKVE
jgi:cytochrome c oxidase subunit 4